MSLNSFAFPTTSRLTEKQEFNQVFAKPAFVKKTPFFLILAIKSPVPQARLGIVVGKRNVKLAVARNKLKRVIREFFRHEQQLLAGMDVVIVVKKNFDEIAVEKQKLPVLLKQIVQGSKCYKD